MANSQVIEQKKQEVKDLCDKIKDAKLVLLVDYRGINVEDVTKLRTDLRNVSSEYLVIKNNIIRRAFEECKIEGLDDEVLTGPTALIVGKDDYLEPSKIIYKFSKDNDYYKMKAGIMDGKVVSVEEIVTLAKLPSREVLLAKLAGSLLGNVTKLAIALDQVSKQKAEANA